MSGQLNQLWNKESVPDPTYVDLFCDLRSTSVYRESVLEQVNVIDVHKDDAIAEQCRQRGNEFIEKNNFKAALEQYHKSLCFADSETVASYAFANRAFCFLELDLYDDCLMDIELAVKAKYPENLMPKLEQRRATCLKKMNASVKRTPFEPTEIQLNFVPHDKVQYMANVLAFRKNDEFGRHLFAKCDIQEDQVVMIEEPMVKLVDDASKYRRCYSCLKQYTSMVPCGLCTKALFCKGCIRDVELHKYDCNMPHLKLFDGRAGNVTANYVKFAIRVIAITMTVFASSDDLMKFAELLRRDHDTNDVIVADETVEAMLGIFLTHHHIVPYDNGRIKIISCIAYDLVMDQPELKSKFPTLKTQRFLMHLVTHLVSIFTSNNILLQNWSEKLSDIIDNNSTGTFGVGVFNISSHINHACMPNVVRLTTTDHLVLKTIRPIKKGEQIFVRYAIDPNWSTAQRQRQLFLLCGFHCKCQLCLSNGPLLTEVSAITAELAELTAELSPLIFLRVKEAHKWTALKERLFEFVRKHDGFPVSKSIILSYEYIRMILMRELSCTAQL